MPSHHPSVLQRTVYLLGSAEAGHLGPLVLAADGRVLGTPDATRVPGTPDATRARYGFQGERFYFLNQAQEKQARLRFDPHSLVFFPDDASSLYLLPLVSLGPSGDPLGNVRLLVNTLPKAGTYLLDLVLAEIGYQGIGLHLLPRECHDNRGVPGRLLHRDPFSRRKFAPAGMVAQIMAAGEYALGHVNDAAQLDQVAQAGVNIMHCQRNLRDVLVSWFRFKRKSVDPVSDGDRLWRRIEGIDGFLAFLCHFAATEVADLRDFALLLAGIPDVGGSGVKLRFEDLMRGVIPEPQRLALDAIDHGLGLMMNEVLPGCLGRESSTLSPQRSEWRSLWSDAVEEFFKSTGLLAANRALGYE